MQCPPRRERRANLVKKHPFCRIFSPYVVRHHDGEKGLVGCIDGHVDGGRLRKKKRRKILARSSVILREAINTAHLQGCHRSQKERKRTLVVAIKALRNCESTTFTCRASSTPFQYSQKFSNAENEGLRTA